MKNDEGSPIDLDDSDADEGMGALVWGLAAIVIAAVIAVILAASN